MAKPDRQQTLDDFLAGLTQIAGEAADLADDGTVITNGEMLRRQIWKQALGYVEEIQNEDGTVERITHKPVGWSQQLLLDLFIGKPGKMAAPLATPSNRPITASDKIDELLIQQLNAMTEAIVKPKAPDSNSAEDLTTEGED